METTHNVNEKREELRWVEWGTYNMDDREKWQGWSHGGHAHRWLAKRIGMAHSIHDRDVVQLAEWVHTPNMDGR